MFTYVRSRLVTQGFKVLYQKTSTKTRTDPQMKFYKVVAGTSECGNEPSGSIKCEEFLD